LTGDIVLSNYGATIDVRSTLLASTTNGDAGIISTGCPEPATTTLESSYVVTGLSSSVRFYEGTMASACSATVAFSTPGEAAAGSTARNTLVATKTGRTACTGDAFDCLKTVFAAVEDGRLKDGVACAIAQGGVVFPDLATDLFAAARTMPASMGAHEYDGTCSP
jgi:hypothetical protein